MGNRHAELQGPERVYRLLLHLYPPSFRLRFGPEMIQVFHDSYPRHSPEVGFATRLWRWTLIDLVWSLPGEWRQALERPRTIELPFRRWADSIVIPFTVAGYLMVEGCLGATLVSSPALGWAAGSCGEACKVASMLKTGVAVALCLGILAFLSSLIAARNRRADGWWIELQGSRRSREVW